MEGYEADMNLTEGTLMNGLNLTSLPETGVVSDQVRAIMEPVTIYLRMMFNIVGIITNTINCRVFINQGVRYDSTNLGFLFLSLCDLLGCATSLPYELCFIVKYVAAIDTMYTCTCIGTILLCIHVPLVQIATWTTVYISLTRAISVVFPLKVKLIFTPAVTAIYLSVVVITSASIQLSYCIFIRVVWVFKPALNTTVLMIEDSPTARHVMYYKQLIAYQILPPIAVTIVTINTVLLSHKLVKAKEWRQSNLSSNNSSISREKTEHDSCSKHTKTPMASRDIELIKSITAVTTIYLVCVLMAFIPSIAVTAYPGVSYNGINKNLFYVSFAIRSLFDAINTSINFFFYIRISTRYKESFAASFKCFSHNRKTMDRESNKS